MTRATSIATYRQIEAEGLLSEQRLAVYQALYRHGPCTAGELAAAMVAEGADGEVRHRVSRRLPELRDVGVAAERGTRVCRAGGRESIVWDVTASLPTGDSGRASTPTKAQLAETVEAMRVAWARGVPFPPGAVETMRWLAKRAGVAIP